MKEDYKNEYAKKVIMIGGLREKGAWNTMFKYEILNYSELFKRMKIIKLSININIV